MNAEKGTPIPDRPGWYLTRIGRAQDDGVEYTEVVLTFYDDADAGDTRVLRLRGAQPRDAIFTYAQQQIDAWA